jgi:hypothetical protein
MSRGDDSPVSELRDEIPDLVAVEQRLLLQFVPPLEPAVVHECVERAAERFNDARVRDHLEVLIERTAYVRLRMLARER